jgi:hypothetical protein
MDREEDYLKFREAVIGDRVLGSLASDQLTKLLQDHYDEHGPAPTASEEEKSDYKRWKIKLRRQYHQESKKWMKEQADLPKVAVEEVDSLVKAMDDINKKAEVSKEEMEKHKEEEKGTQATYQMYTNQKGKVVGILFRPRQEDKQKEQVEQQRAAEEQKDKPKEQEEEEQMAAEAQDPSPSPSGTTSGEEGCPTRRRLDDFFGREALKQVMREMQAYQEGMIVGILFTLSLFVAGWLIRIVFLNFL